MNWIRIEKETPPENQRVLCMTRKNGIKILSVRTGQLYSKGTFYWKGESVNGIVQRFQSDEVTHWMHLPEAPL